MNRKYFGTDGVRGGYGGPLMNEDFAARLGFAAAKWLGSRQDVLIGRDPRYSGTSLEAAMARGLRAGGANPISLGIIPTPAVARTMRVTRAALGVVITASHNPAEDNGIKFFGPAGLKLKDAEELSIENLLPAEVPAMPANDPPMETRPTAVSDYVAAMTGLLPANALKGWKIVVDTAHGATCGTTPVVLRALGAEVIGLGESPNGRNINEQVGSEHPGQMAAQVLATGARLGIAHDGDGDRCVLSDEAGHVLDGDEILTLLARHALKSDSLMNNTLVVTHQSNLGVDASLAHFGGRVVRTPIGDRYVMQRMREEGATLGGESSGHIICSDISPTGDGLIASLRVIEVMLETGKPLSELRRALRKFPQLTAAIPVKEKTPLASLTKLTAALRQVETDLGSKGRVMARYSGTETKLRLLVEGPTDDEVAAGMEKLKAAVREEGIGG
jgi:phosphoglucosamine mutase